MSKSRMIRAVLAGIALVCGSHAAFAGPIFSPDGQVYPDGSSSYLKPESSVLINSFGYVDEFFIRDFLLDPPPGGYVESGGNGFQSMTANFFAEFRDVPGGTVQSSVDLPGIFKLKIDGRPGVHDVGVYDATTLVARFEGLIAPGVTMITDLDPHYALPIGVVSITPVVGGPGYLFDIPVPFVVHARYCVYTDNDPDRCVNPDGNWTPVGPLEHDVPVPATGALILLGLLAGQGLRRRFAKT